ncbi:Flp pilus assembly protein CpaB [Aquisediminimonas profunda]|uniref:Flp pilus assembly protein CpaB n=1 Tax=Aquisediminimonas profunda TaxID=1550733 RepID=UPI001C627E43|nr:Flp pilus assembly protein CpaB [Aquisediminimonas profunda]
MPQQRSLIVLGLAILLGLVAVYLANVYLGGVEKKQEVVQQGNVKVAVARVPMDFGTEITPDKVQMVDFPSAAVPQGTFSSISTLLPMNKRRVALRPISVNEPILATNVSGEGGRAAISAVLRADMRAASVRVNDVAGVSGFVLPGDTVDILITRSVPSAQDGTPQQITDVLLQNVRVIAIDQNANQNAEQPVISKTATFEVSQVDAQKLALGQQVGTLSLALRNIADEVNPVVQTVGLEDLRDGAYGGGYRAPGPSYLPSSPRGWTAFGNAAVARKKRNQVTVQIVRGTTNTSYEVRRHAGF